MADKINYGDNGKVAREKINNIMDEVEAHIPSIGENNHWYLGETDTGVPATGPQGKQGEDGEPGKDGKDGVDGVDGKDGIDGKDGKDGQDGYTPVKGVDYFTEEDIQSLDIPTTASDIGALPDSTKYGASISLSINSSTYVITAQLKDQDGNSLGNPQTIDLPLESVVVSGSYDDETKKIILTLENGNTVEFSVADLVAGLQSEITSENKLDADLVDDTNSSNKFVSTSEKNTWNGKQNALSTQTAYTQKGSATKVPQITTNTLGQVTGITEITITQPDISGKVSGPSSSTDGDIALFDGATGKVIKDSGVALSSKANASDLNTKTFYLSSTSDTTTAQSAYDWYSAGKNPIIVLSDKTYEFIRLEGDNLIFQSSSIEAITGISHSTERGKMLRLNISSSTVSSITSLNFDIKYLDLEQNYGTPYTPTYNGSPATKKYVDDKYADLMAMGKFLSLWNSATGQPISFPLDTPYIYHTGDYFMVEILATGGNDNLMPNGSSYTGSASQTPDTTNEVKKGDFYIYDGTVRLYASNHGKDVSFSNIAGQPTDNTNLAAALVDKQDKLVSGTNIKTINNNSILGDGDLTVSGLPTGGTVGQILVMTSNGPAWADPIDVDIVITDTNAPIPVRKIWGGEDSDYSGLQSYDSNEAYLTVPDSN